MKPFQPSGRPIPTEVLQHVIRTYNSKQDAAILAKCARISSAGHEIAIPILYRDIHIYSEKQARRLFEHLSIEIVDQDGIPTTTHEPLIDIPLQQYGIPTRVQIGKGSRKLSHFLLVHSVTLEHDPTEAAFDGSEVDGQDKQYKQYRRYELDRGVHVLVPGNTDHFIIDLNFPAFLYSPLFPSARGTCLGRSLITDLCDALKADHPSCHLAQSTSTHCSLDRRDVRRISAMACSQRGNFGYLDKALSLLHPCFTTGHVPPNICPGLLKTLGACLLEGYFAGDYITRLASHSTFPDPNFADIVRGRAHWRHFIHINQKELSFGDVDIGCSDTGMPTLSNHSLPNDVSPGKEVPDQSDLLRQVAESIYQVCVDTLEDVAYSDKPRRRDFIFDGISQEQVRELEDIFVEVVIERFDDPDDVIIDPSQSLRQRRRTSVSAETQSAAENGDAFHSGSSEYYDGSMQELDEWDSNDNWYEDDGADPKDPYVVREYQRRVKKFDFLHADSCTPCHGCGQGGSKLTGKTRKKAAFTVWTYKEHLRYKDLYSPR
jgi:hypothetical protein